MNEVTAILCTKIATAQFRVVITTHDGQRRTALLGVWPEDWSQPIQPPSAERVLKDLAARPHRWTAFDPVRP
jgi:hypothetical protein